MKLETRETIIQAYLDAGYRLFDCFTYDKSPVDPGWKLTPPGVKPTSTTYGIPLGDDDLILDYDGRRDPSKLQLVEFWNECGLSFPQPTFTVRTNDGCHIYYHKPLDWKVRGSTVPGYPAIEIKSKGQYVIAAGSLHKSGTIYQVVRGTPATVIEAPVPVLNKCKMPDQIERGTGVCDDSEWNQKRFIDWIRAGNHSNGLYVIANQGKDYGLSADTITSIILNHCNPFWSAPASMGDIQSRVNHAFQYGQNLPGSKNTGETAYEHIASVKPKSRILETFVSLWDQSIGVKTDPETGEKHSYTKGIKPTTPSVLAQACLPNYRDSRTPTLETPNPLFDMLRFNQFSQDIEFKHPAPWHFPGENIKAWRTVDASLMSVWLSQHTPIINPEERQIERAMLALAYNDQYHPVRQWLQSLTWDGVPRLNTWLIDYASAADTIYVREIGKNFLIAACARVWEPGVQHDSAIVFEGEQGIGKTSAIRILGGPWYGDISIDPRVKDTYINMLGKWFIEMSEMAFMRQVDVEATKRFLTITTDVFRLPYDKRGSSIPRQSVFAGSVNPGPNGYLRDITGARRFWVVGVGQVNLDGLQEVRDQLFAEAFTRYRMKEKHHIVDPRIQAMARAEADKRMVREVWAEEIETYLNNPQSYKPEYITTSFIAMNILGLSPGNRDHKTQHRISHAMTALGYQNTPKRFGRSSQRVWVRKVNNPELEAF